MLSESPHIHPPFSCSRIQLPPDDHASATPPHTLGTQFHWPMTGLDKSHVTCFWPMRCEGKVARGLWGKAVCPLKVLTKSYKAETQHDKFPYQIRHFELEFFMCS